MEKTKSVRSYSLSRQVQDLVKNLPSVKAGGVSQSQAVQIILETFFEQNGFTLTQCRGILGLESASQISK